jgi:peptidoglycan/LPS O-acetylase OafA/YrhL
MMLAKLRLYTTAISRMINRPGMDAAGANSNPRYRSLDAYRFIAASLVVLYHYNADFGLGLENSTPIAKGLTVMVDFFFVLSGFVIAMTYAGAMSNLGDYGRFLQRRLARIFPLHLAVLSVFVALGLALKFGWLRANHPEGFEFGTLPANALLLNAWGTVSHLTFNYPSWSISAEWLAYLAFPALLMLSRRLSPAANLTIVIGTVAALALWRNTTTQLPWYEATYDFGALRALPTFYLGIVLAGLLESSPRSFRLPWPAVHLLFLSAVATIHFDLPREVTIALLALVVPFAAAAERNNRPSVMMTGFMVRLGDASYAVYMIHSLFALPVQVSLRKFGAIGTPLSSLLAVTTYVVVVIAACLIYARFEVVMRRRISGFGAQGQSARLANPSLTAPAV